MKCLVEFINESISQDDLEFLFEIYIDILDSNYKTEGKSFVEAVVIPLADGVDIEEFLENFMYDHPDLEWLEQAYKNPKNREEIDGLIIRHINEWLKDKGFE